MEHYDAISQLTSHLTILPVFFCTLCETLGAGHNLRGSQGLPTMAGTLGVG